MLLDINYLFSCNFHDFIAYHNHSIMVAFSNLHLSPLFFTHYNLLIVSYSPHFYDFLFKSLPNIYQNHPHHDLFLVPSHRAVVVNYLISRFSIHLNYTSTQLISLNIHTTHYIEGLLNFTFHPYNHNSTTSSLTQYWEWRIPIQTINSNVQRLSIFSN